MLNIFLLCSGLTSLIIPNSVTSIGSDAFSNCSSLASIEVLGDNSIYDSRDYCNAIIEKQTNTLIVGCKNTIIPNSVASIGANAFRNCYSLTSITIPNSVKSIEDEAFSGCNGLKVVHSLIEKPFDIDEDVFDSYNDIIYTSATLYVPIGTRGEYQATNGWKKFENIEEEVQEGDIVFENKNIVYALSSKAQTATVKKVGGSYLDVVVPAEVKYGGLSYMVTNIGDSVLCKEDNLSVIFPPTISKISEKAFSGCRVPVIILQSNEISLSDVQVEQAMKMTKNSLLYVPSANVLPKSAIDRNNIVINGVAKSVVLVDATKEYWQAFHCPQEFIANNISYSHKYSMTTGIGSSSGWETIALPFEVQNITHESKGKIIPFANYTAASAEKPFWLYKLSTSGFIKASKIEAVVPYLISMPNNIQYASEYNLSGIVTFSATSARVKTTKDDDANGIKGITHKGKEFRPCFRSWETHKDFHCINAVNDFANAKGKSTSGEEYLPGSVFVSKLRNVMPFEGYFFYIDSSNAREFIPIEFANDAVTGLEEVLYGIKSNNADGIRIYNMAGQLLRNSKSMTINEATNGLPAGLYVINGKKVIVR